jgi:PAS domain S-box-containing protein
VHWNSEAARLFGYAPEEVPGQTLGVIVQEEYREAHRDAIG